MTNTYKNHVIRTEDESLWFHFSGEVPRVGEIIEPIENEKEYIVKKVRWFMEQTVYGPMCSARVFVEEIKEASDSEVGVKDDSE